MDICRASPPAGSDPFSVSWQRPGLYGACSRPPPPRSGCVSRDDPWLPLTPSPGCLGPELPTSPPPGQGPLLSGADSWCQAFQAPLFLPRPPPRPPGVPCSPCQRPRCEHRLSVKQRPAPSLTAPATWACVCRPGLGPRHLRSLSLPALRASVLGAFVSRPLPPPAASPARAGACWGQHWPFTIWAVGVRIPLRKA